MTAEEIKFKVNNVNAIWGIEGMEMTEAEKIVAEKYLAGEIAEEDFQRVFLSANSEEDK